jgi:hypothetical protein
MLSILTETRNNTIHYKISAQNGPAIHFMLQNNEVTSSGVFEMDWAHA